MDAELEYNGKLFGFRGFITRRDYFLNLLYIQMICWVLFLPQMNYIVSEAGVLEDFLNFNKLLLNAPLLIKAWAVISATALAWVKTANAVRRLNDIFSYSNKFINIISLIIISAFCFSLFMPVKVIAFALILYLILQIFLLFKKGKISSKMPYDYLKEFNWGAYFGTWIWGLFNSSYKTLWMIPLSFTPLGFYYAFICGLKGNAWAFKGKVWESLEKFKKSQDIQTIIFTIIYLIILPIITITITIGLIAALAVSIASWDGSSEAPKKLNQVVKNVNSIYFESYKITKKENIFYVNPADWKNYNFLDKKKIFDFASSTAAAERNAKYSLENHSKSTELLRTKIYSSKTHELLGEFSIDENKMIKQNGEVDAKALFKALLTAYKFYNPKI